MEKKNESSTDIYISTNISTELNELIYEEAKLVCEEIGVALKSTKKIIKTWMGNSTGKADENLRKQAKIIKQRDNTGTCRDNKEKATQGKNNNTT